MKKLAVLVTTDSVSADAMTELQVSDIMLRSASAIIDNL
jgi:hypothetical protein